MPKVQVIFYSMSGRVARLAAAIAEGAGQLAGADVRLLRIQELPGGPRPMPELERIPLASVDHLAEADALIIGSPTRFGSMAAPLRAFWDSTGELWLSGALVGKLGSAFVGTGTQHGGHESTILSMWQTFAHHGMVIAGVPYGCDELRQIAEVSGGSPYGAGTVGGMDGGAGPSENELAIARFQGLHVAKLAERMFG